jgi:hypothetical protein
MSSTTNIIDELDIEPYYNNIEFDYPFPNLNTIKPFAVDRNTRMEKIQKMYYDKNAEENWFKN